MAMDMCKQTKSIYMHTPAGVHKADLAIAPNKRHARYFMDIISSTAMRRDSFAELFSIAAHCLKFLCTLHKKIEVICIIPHHRMWLND
jgi:hypothetical protein